MIVVHLIRKMKQIHLVAPKISPMAMVSMMVQWITKYQKIKLRKLIYQHWFTLVHFWKTLSDEWGPSAVLINTAFVPVLWLESNSFCYTCLIIKSEWFMNDCFRRLKLKFQKPNDRLWSRWSDSSSRLPIQNPHQLQTWIKHRRWYHCPRAKNDK